MAETSSGLAVMSAMDAPMSSSLGAMGPLLRKLDSLLPPDSRLPKLLKDRIELLKEDLEEISDALLEQSMVDSPNEMAKFWMNEVRALLYDIEDFIDSMMSKHADATTRSVKSYKVGRVKIAWLPKTALNPRTRAARITEFRALVRESIERHYTYLDDGCISSSRSVFTGHARVPVLYPEAANNLVGVDDSKMKLIQWLTHEEEQQLKVVAIVGPAGVGKTTLAKQVYHDLGERFECRAFVRASRKPDMWRLLGGILSQVQGDRRPFDSCTVQNLIDNLIEHLQDKRYVIVIDDLWETTAWDIVTSAFPEGNNHSRIITTAEIESVALECCHYQSNNIFEIKPLGSEDATGLLFSLVFGPERLCPEELNGVVDIIITKCAGLPLATICVAGLLTSQTGNTELWQHVQECLCSTLSTNSTLEETLQEVLKLSYNSLPHYLKTCLMHLCMYPEGYTMWKVDLVKQWIAEGYIGATEGTEVGEVADSYFGELVNRGMIQPVDINYNAEVLSCTLCNVVLDLITHESNEENFITALDYSQTVRGLYSKARRLSLHFSNTRYAMKPTGPTLSKVRSIGFFGILECVPSVVEFKLLRVLILEFWGNHRGSTSFNLTRICRLVQLRYLKISCDASVEVELPTQVRMLQYLETLIIDAVVSAIPLDIIHLPSLWHLSLGNKIDLPDEIGRIRSLRTLHYFDVRSNSEDNVLSLGDLMNLQDLHLTYFKESDEHPTEESDEHLKRNLRALASSLVKLVNLRSVTLAPGASATTIYLDVRSSMPSPPIFLQRLELLPPICIFSRLPEWIGQLQKLCILKVVVSELLMKDMDMLIGLPALTILSLYVRQPTAESIIFKRGAFLGLKYFKYSCGVLPLTFQEESFPNLQRLELSFNAHRGVQYDHLLSGIDYLLNLKDIVGTIGAAADAEEPDRRAAESAFKDAIRKHPRFPSYDNVKRVDRVCEEYQLRTQGKDSSSENHEILQKEHIKKEEDSSDDQFKILVKETEEYTKQHSDRISHFPATGSIISFDHQMKTGLMENFSPRTLLNSISDLSVLTSDGSTSRPKPIQRYCQNVCHISSIVSPLIEDICKSPEEQLSEVLRELDTAINEASGLIGNWHQTTSKIYFVWQIESVISDIQGCSLQLCQLANSLLPSLTGCACICIQNLENINYENMFDLAKEVAVELTGQGTQSPANLSVVSSSLSLSTNLELYMEAVSLENLRARAVRTDNRKELDLVEQMIPMVNYMHERLLRETQLLNINGVPIPADFCCPLSLELMSDPVTLASGHTYERVYIKLWLDEGFTICPKTRQRLAHSNFIPNYTVKALISNWCESHDIKLPDPVKSLKLNFPSAASTLQDLTATGNSPLHPSIVGRWNVPGFPEADLYMRSLNRASPPPSVVNQNSDAHVNCPGHEASTNQSSDYAKGSAPDIARLSLASSEARESSLEERHAGSIIQTSEQSREEASHLNSDSQEHLGISSANRSLPNSGQLDGEGDMGNGMIQVSSDRTNCSSDASGEVADGGPSSASAAPQRENVILPRLVIRGQFVQRQASDRGFARIISSSSMDARGGLAEDIRATTIEPLDNHQLSIYDLDTIKVIGKGRSGNVQLVRHKWTGQFIALKVMQLNIQENIRKQIAQELKISLSTQCQYVVTCHQCFYVNGVIYIALEYMDGGSLADFLKTVKTVPEAYLAAICKQVLKGLMYLHQEKHIIHRNLKPSNILINHQGEIKISDFGVSAIIASSSAERDTFTGTYKYMAPERISGQKHGYMSDIWSLGLVMLECATGNFPYPSPDSFYELLEAVVDQPPPSAPSDQYSPEFCSFISTCTQKKAEDRSSAQTLLGHPFLSMYGDLNINLADYFTTAGSLLATFNQIAL